MKTVWQHLYSCILIVSRTFVHSSQQCRSVLFYKESGFALDGHVIETSSLHPDDCLWYCSATVNCFSVNVRKVTHAILIFLSICLTNVNYLFERFIDSFFFIRISRLKFTKFQNISKRTILWFYQLG